MDWIFLGMIIFLFGLAIFDLWVGVSNDAVNFLNGAVGAKAASFKTVIAIAAVGVFFGCVLSDGMMDIARHGIFTPTHFSFNEVMLIYMAVMVTDIVLLDMFNSFGMPTSTTVSLVFEMLGAAFAFTLIKVLGDTGLSFEECINSAKAVQVIMGIFFSVPIAFVFGALVQYISRIIFSFNLKKGLGLKIGLFGGLAITSIIYFMLFKGLKHLSFMTDDVVAYINDNVLLILGCCLVVFTVLSQVLHWLKVNVFRIVVLVGTFALATAFAGNDLVNFLGVPLAGLSAYQDFSTQAGANPDSYMMTSLMESASTPFIFLFSAGVIMVIALATSKKAHTVLKTSLDLSRKNEGDEMFGSSKAARSLVRWGNSVGQTVTKVIPDAVLRAIDRRFVVPAETQDNTVAYDLLRASVNLVMASLLIALGTSLKLPLSTTFVTFMVAMGTSLADRAWTRESAVFRITGVLTVIGGWFITAGAAFAACSVVATLMYYGGPVVMLLLIAGCVYCLISSSRSLANKSKEMREGDILFQEILQTNDQKAVVPMLQRHIGICSAELLERYKDCLKDTTEGLFTENLRALRKTSHVLGLTKREIKNLRRRETICLRRTEPTLAVRLSTDFHLVHNSLRQILYGLVRLTEPALDHVDNNFTPISKKERERYLGLRQRTEEAMQQVAGNLRALNFAGNDKMRAVFETIREDLRTFRHEVLVDMQAEEANLSTLTLLLHVIQETEQICAEMTDFAHYTVRLEQMENI